jgi:flagellar biosynthesis chaperone FliJ
MFLKKLLILLVCAGIVISFSCAGIEKGKDFATGIISHEVDEKLFSQVPDEKKDAINPLLDTVQDAKDRLELSKALVNKKEAELDLEKANKDLAKIQLEIREAELNLEKMRAVQSVGLGDPKKVNQQVAKLEAKVYKLKGEEAKQKAKIENAKLVVIETQQKIDNLKTKTQKETTEIETKKEDIETKTEK